MRVINENPFRILGITSNATPAIKLQAKNKILAYIKIDKTPQLDFDLTPPLAPVNRTNDLVEMKSNQILSDQEKLLASLFWFVSGGTIDDIALDKLCKEKNPELSLETFKKGAGDFQVNKSNISSIINYSTLAIINFPNSHDENTLKEAVDLKLKIAQNTDHLKLLEVILGTNLITKSFKPDQIKSAVTQHLKEGITSFFPTRDKISLFKKFFDSDKEIIRGLQNEMIKIDSDSIKSFIQKNQIKRNEFISKLSTDDTMIQCGKLGESFLKDTTPILNKIGLTNPNCYEYNQCLNEVMNEVNYCMVGALNKFNSDFETALKNSQVHNFCKNNPSSCFQPMLSLGKTTSNYILNKEFNIKDTLVSNIKTLIESDRDYRSLSIKYGQNSSDDNTASIMKWGVIIIVIWAILLTCN